MINLRMEEKLKAGECLDVNKIGKPHPQMPRVWILPEVIDGMDYCDAAGESWIWSIGRNIKTGEILAARDERYCHSKLEECVWSR